ncbi:sigma factor G inhibitor Gin [Desulfosporosinus sp. FKA]|uniref:sigma factor G inhibitor Gin n=1 Tax=Desulfosporosinus sp. FKA TaxID=1969834 RepID=UPI000B4974A5|nr:sigma factor G inhibitor Gin [Desulfosporosinus sp. FKA]
MIKADTIQLRGPGEGTDSIKDQKTVINKGKVYPVCYRCAQVPKNGLYDGFRIRGMFFCSDCQRELYSADQDTPEYREFLVLIQGLLF